MAPTSYEVRDSVLVEVFFLLLISVFLGELPGCRRPSGSLVVPNKGGSLFWQRRLLEGIVSIWGKNWQVGLVSWPDGDRVADSS